MSADVSSSMKDVKTLSDSELELRLKDKVAEERKLTVEVIQLLKEVSRRKLYLERGFGSLIEYCIRELGYSESSAYRRVAAMRIAKEVPQVTEALSAGKLNLVNVARAHSFFKREEKERKPLDIETKREVLENLVQKSSRQAEKILLALSPNATLPIEKVKAVTPELTQVTLILNEELCEKLNELKSLFSHKNVNPSYRDLIELMADFTLKKLRPNHLRNEARVVEKNMNPERIDSENAMQHQRGGATNNSQDMETSQVKPKRPAQEKPQEKKQIQARKQSQIRAQLQTSTQLQTSKELPTRTSRHYISKAIRQKVWERAQNQCCYTDPRTNRQCASKFQLQLEHILPVAKGGSGNLENLELLCAQHNQLRASQQFGRKHMEQFSR